MKYSWELEELDPQQPGSKIPYVVKRLREDEDGELVFKKVYASDWRQGIASIRGSLDLLEAALQAQEKMALDRQAAKDDQKTVKTNGPQSPPMVPTVSRSASSA